MDLKHDQRATVGRLDPFILTEMLKASEHVDQKYVEDLIAGFPVIGKVHSHGTGEPIPGGRRTHGQPAHGIVPDLARLQTIKRAQARIPRTDHETKLAEATWDKIMKEQTKGQAGEPIDLEDFPLQEALLVDTFGIWERHGAADKDTLRIINDFKANQANEFAYMPEKLAYNGFGEAKETCTQYRKRCDRQLRMGKADFK